MFPDKRDLRALLKAANELRARLPESAQPLHRALAGLVADLNSRLQAVVPWVRAAELADLRGRLATLASLTEGLLALLEEVGQWEGAEDAFAAERRAQQDAALERWFAERAEPRRARLAAAALTISDADSLAKVRAGLGQDAEQRRFDRELFDLFAEAAQRVRPFLEQGGAAPIRALADALPELRRRLLAEARPSADLVLRLKELVSAARALADRPKPPQLDECFGLIEGMAAWVEVLREGLDPDAPPQPELDRAERAWREVGAEFNSLAQHWQQQEEGVFTALIERAMAVERALLALAKAEQASLTQRLERNRDLLNQFADASLSPGLSERIGALLAGTPDTPATFQRWREQCRQAEEDFIAAIGADSDRLEARCAETAAAIAERLATWEQAPLDDHGRADWLRLRRRLAEMAPPAAGGLPVPTLLARLQALAALDQAVADWVNRANAALARLARRRAWLAERAARLLALRDGLLALGIPAPALEAPALAAPAERDGTPALAPLRRALADWRSRLVQAETALSPGPVQERLAGFARLRGLLEPDLAAGVAQPPSPAPGVAALAASVAALPAAERALDAALAEQAQRLRTTRPALRERLALADGAGWSAAERAAAARLLGAFSTAEPTDDPRVLVPLLREQFDQAEALLRHLAQTRQALEHLAEGLGRRLATLRREYFELDTGPATGGALVERAWALLQPPPDLLPPPVQRLAQLREVEHLLDVLARHGRALVALHLERAQAARASGPKAGPSLAPPPPEERRQWYLRAASAGAAEVA